MCTHLSTLEIDRAYTHSYSSIGIALFKNEKDGGDLTKSWFHMFLFDQHDAIYMGPLLPHYLHPLSLARKTNVPSDEYCGNEQPNQVSS